MKYLKFIYLVLTAFLLVFTISSCKKDKNTDNSGDTTETTAANESTYRAFTATVNGIPFAADTSLISYSFDSNSNLHVFSAPDGLGNIMNISLATLLVNTHTVDFDNTIVTYQNGTLVFDGANNPQGTVVITSNQNNKISGTYSASLFNFNTATSANVASGVFNNIPYSN